MIVFFCKLNGWGRVTSLLNRMYPVFVVHDNKNCSSYCSDGKLTICDKYPCLLTRDEAIQLGENPPVVKKKVTFWLNIYPDMDPATHKTKGKAETAAAKNALHVAVPFTSDVELEMPE